MCPQKVNKRNYRKITKPYCKMVSKELQYGYSKGTSPAECEIFFFLFLGISGTGFSSSDCSPSQFVILRAAQAVSRFVCKKARPFRDELFCIFCRPEKAKNRLPMRKSMTLRNFAGHFACFSAKDIYKVWRGGGLYSGGLCGTVYTINL